MAVVKTTDKIQVKMLLNNGTDPSTGEIRTVSVNLGTINPATYDADKAMAIAMAVENILTKPLYTLQETVTSSLVED